jgi:hypothetical protein
MAKRIEIVFRLLHQVIPDNLHVGSGCETAAAVIQPVAGYIYVVDTVEARAIRGLDTNGVVKRIRLFNYR